MQRDGCNKLCKREADGIRGEASPPGPRYGIVTELPNTSGQIRSHTE